MKVMLVCSGGGHLQQILALRPAWHDFDTSWVVLPGPDVDYLLRGQPVVFGHGPTNRSVSALVRNLGLAWRVLRRDPPDVILSTGAGLAVPFFVIGKMFGSRLVYVESLTRIRSLSLTGKLVCPLADHFFVQWQGAGKHCRHAEFAGSIL